jgi:hypothetical protein
VCRCRCLTVASGGSGTLLAAERLVCLPEMLIIVSGMSIQDPREQPGRSRDATTGAGDESLILVAAYSDSVEGRPKRLDDRDCLTPTALRRLRNQSTATWRSCARRGVRPTVARLRSEPTLCAMSIGQHRCFGSKVSFVNTDRWSLESEVRTRVLPGTTVKWSS